MTTRVMHFYDPEVLALRQKFVRRFENCAIWEGERDGVFYLLLDERARKQTTLCAYESRAEFEEDRDHLLNQPGNAAG